MIGLATSVLVRYFTQDDPTQSRKASELMERRLTEDDPGFVSLVTMAETVWVLGSVYALSDLEIVGVVESMLQADVLIIQNKQEVFTAAVALRTGTGSFADALIGALGRWAGCDSTLTFNKRAVGDKKAARLSNFELL